MKNPALFFLLLLTTSALVGAVETPWHFALTKRLEAKALMESVEVQGRTQKVPIGVLDISFYGHQIIAGDALARDAFVRPSKLYSPHGSEVISLLSSARVGGSDHSEIRLLSTGIFTEDFELAFEQAKSKNLRLIHASLALRDEDVAAQVQKAADEQDIIFVLSSGNSAQRLGRGLKPYYQNLRAIIVSCIDEEGQVADFAQLDSSVTVLAPCGMNNIPAETISYKQPQFDREGNLIEPSEGEIVIGDFGQTSAGAPQVSAAIIDLLSLYPQLSVEEVRELLRESATLFVDFEGQRFPVLNHYSLIQTALKKFK